MTVSATFFITSPEGHRFRTTDDSTELIAQAGVPSPQVSLSEVCQYRHLLQSCHPISKENPQATTRLRGWVKCWGNKNESNIVSAPVSFYVSGTTLYFWEQFILTVSMSLFLIYTQRLNKARTTRTPVKEIELGRCCGRTPFPPGRDPLGNVFGQGKPGGPDGPARLPALVLFPHREEEMPFQPLCLR